MTKPETTVTKDQLFQLVASFQAKRAAAPECSISEELGKACMTITSNMMKTPRWRGYPLDVKADMQSSALLRCMRACVLADTSMGAQKVMSYFIRAIWLAFKRVVDSYYDDLQKKDAFMREALRRQGVSEQKIACLLKRPEGKTTMNVVQSKWKGGYKSEAKRKKEAAEKETRKKLRKLKKNSKKEAIS